MRTTNKTVVNQLREHVLSHFEYETDDDVTKFSPIQALKSQVDYMQGLSAYHTGLDLVDGGKFLIYYTEINEFLNGLGINNNRELFSDVKSWKQYRHLIAREINNLVNN